MAMQPKEPMLAVPGMMGDMEGIAPTPPAVPTLQPQQLEQKQPPMMAKGGMVTKSRSHPLNKFYGK